MLCIPWAENIYLTFNFYPPLSPLSPPPACQNRCGPARLQTPSEHDEIYGEERRNVPRNCQPTDTRLKWSIIKMIMNSVVAVENGVASPRTHAKHTQTSLCLAPSAILTCNMCVCACVTESQGWKDPAPSPPSNRSRKMNAERAGGLGLCVKYYPSSHLLHPTLPILPPWLRSSC